MANSEHEKAKEEAQSPAEGGGSQSPQEVAGSPDTTELRNFTPKGTSSEKDGPQKSVGDQDASNSVDAVSTTKSAVSIDISSYDPENPMDFFLKQEEKYAAKYVPNSQEDDFRVADVDNLINKKSVLCWAVVTIMLVGGSLAAVAMTVDWDSTHNTDVTNSTMIDSP